MENDDWRNELHRHILLDFQAVNGDCGVIPISVLKDIEAYLDGLIGYLGTLRTDGDVEGKAREEILLMSLEMRNALNKMLKDFYKQKEIYDRKNQE